MLLAEYIKNIFQVLFDPRQRKLYLVFLLYAALFVLGYSALYFFNLYTLLPNKENIVNWDAMWYNSIKTKGYEYYWYMASNSAFFPLFPYIWKLLHSSPYGICLINFLVFVVGISFLYKTFSISLSKILLYISLPTGLFFMLPYSESFFFFFSSLYLVGLYKKDQKLIFIGLLLSSLTRATAMFFLPSIIVMEVMNSSGFLDRNALKNILLYSFASILGLLLVVLFQYALTLEWFPFAKQQFRFWRHHFGIPTFPLVSHGGENIIWIDSFAFLAGITASVLVVVLGIKKVFLNYSHAMFSNRPFWFSCAYILMVTIYSLFFNPKCLEVQTSVDSMNRYVFCTSFFFVFFVFVLDYFRITLKNYLMFMVLLLVTLFLFGLNGAPLFFIDPKRYGEQGSLLFFAGVFIYINLHYLSSSQQFGKYIACCLFGFNILITTYYLHTFISGNWAG